VPEIALQTVEQSDSPASAIRMQAVGAGRNRIAAGMRISQARGNRRHPQAAPPGLDSHPVHRTRQPAALKGRPWSAGMGPQLMPDGLTSAQAVGQ